MKPDVLTSLAAGASPTMRARINALRAHAVASVAPADQARVSATLAKRDAHEKQGRTAQRNGASSEGIVDEVLRALRLAGTVADYQRHDAAVKASGEKVLYRVAGPCDFTGILSTREGFAIEVKSGARVWRSKAHAVASRKPHDPHLSDRQSAQLFAYDAADCLALVVMVVDGVPRAMPYYLLASLWDAAGCVVAAEWERVSTMREAIMERGAIEGGG